MIKILIKGLLFLPFALITISISWIVAILYWASEEFDDVVLFWEKDFKRPFK